MVQTCPWEVPNFPLFFYGNFGHPSPTRFSDLALHSTTDTGKNCSKPNGFVQCNFLNKKSGQDFACPVYPPRADCAGTPGKRYPALCKQVLDFAFPNPEGLSIILREAQDRSGLVLLPRRKLLRNFTWHASLPALLRRVNRQASLFGKFPFYSSFCEIIKRNPAHTKVWAGEREKQKLRCFVVGISYFPTSRGRKYHRIRVLSLLCSEWEEVGHTRIKHRQQSTADNRFVSAHAPIAKLMRGFVPFIKWRKLLFLRSFRNPDGLGLE